MRMVLAEMRAAALGALRCAVGHAQRQLQHLLRAVGGDQFRVGASGRAAQADAAAAIEQGLQLAHRRGQIFPGAEDADLVGHDLLHGLLQHRGVLGAAALGQPIQLGLLGRHTLAHQAGGDEQVVGAGIAEVGNIVTDDHAGHHGLGHRVAAQPVEAMHVPAGGLAGGEQTLHRRALAGVVGAHAAHGVVLGRAHRDHLLHRVDAEEGLADLLDLAQVLLDVGAAEQGDVQPQVLTKARLRALALADMRLHAARHHVARGQLLLLGLVVGHETVAVDVLEQAAVAAAALGDQDAGREDAGGVELHRFHVAQRGDAGFQRDRGAHALADHRVGGHPVQPPGAAGGDAGGLGHIGAQFASDQVTHHSAVAAAGLVDQRDRLHALMHGNSLGDGAVTHRVQHGVAGAVRDIAGAPLLGAAKIALRHQAMGLVTLGQRDLLAVDDDLPVAAVDTAPGHAPGCQLTHRLGRGIDKHAHHALVGTPVAAAHGVLEVHVLVVTLALDDIGQRGLHAALRRRRV